MARILIVDDDSDMAELLAHVLRGGGHAVRVARNGQEGLASVHTERPDVILLDVEMPVMTGPDMALALLVRDCGLEKIPIVLSSGVLNLHEVASSIGTPYFLPKPSQLEQLSSVLSTALVERQAPQPPARPA